MDISRDTFGERDPQRIDLPVPAESNASAQATSRALTGNTARAVQSLVDMFGDGLVSFGAINPQTGEFRGATADLLTERDRIHAGIEAAQGKHNLYFRMNEPAPRDQQQGKKGAIVRADVRLIRGVAVDIDPPKDVESQPGGLAAWQRRKLEELKPLIEGPYGPTAIVGSGGGYQLLWIFHTGLPAAPETIAAVEALSKALARLYGGDAIHDVTHLLRIPFTGNLPDARKLARGRKPAVSWALFAEPPKRYTVEELQAGVPSVAVEEIHPPAPPFNTDDAWFAAGNSDELPDELIAQVQDARARHRGFDRLLSAPALEVGSGKRSEHDFAVACAAIEAGITHLPHVAAIVTAYGSDKYQEKVDQHGRPTADAYLVNTVNKAFRRAETTAARDRALLTPIEDEDEDGAATAASADNPIADLLRPATRVSGIRTYTGLPEVIRTPRREYVISPRAPLGGVLLTAGGPGVGKSTSALHDGVAITSGREDILRGVEGISPERLHISGPAIVQDSEDTYDEMERRLYAMLQHHGIRGPDELKHPLYLWSGVGDVPLWLAKRNRHTKALEIGDGAAALYKAIVKTGAIYTALGPFASLAEGLNENDASECTFVMQIARTIAMKTRCCLNIVHHTSKSGSGEAGDMNAVRGSSAIVAAARAAVTVNMLPEEDARRYGVTAHNHFAMHYAKVSHGQKPTHGIIYRRDSVTVGNGLGANSDPRDAFDLPAQEALRVEGDRAPALTVVGVGSAVSREEVREQKRTAVEDGTIAAILTVLGCVGRRALTDVLPELTTALREQRAIRGSAANTVREHLRNHLPSPGRLASFDGQDVRVKFEKDGPKHTDPWFLVVETTSESVPSNP